MSLLLRTPHNVDLGFRTTPLKQRGKHVTTHSLLKQVPGALPEDSGAVTH